ncbi:MAG: N-acetyltransferase [bacterium]
MLRRAQVRDVKAIKSLIDRYREEGNLLPRALTEIYENVRDFFVIEEDDEIGGCAALHVVWEDLAEIKSLVIDKRFRGRGYGDQLILATMRETRDLQIGQVFALTAIPSYFVARGFEEKDKSTLPHKVWAECVKCHKFPDCDEIAVGASVTEWFASYGARLEAAEVT